ncbi:MAG: flagellar biosynthetic protein FliR [Aliishimia sp.]
MDIPVELLAFLEGQMTATFAVFLRMSAFFSLMPGFGEQSIPTRIKLALSVMMTVFVSPAVTPTGELPAVTSLIFSEIVTGVALGLMIRLFVLSLQTAGAIAAQATSLSQLFGGSAAEPLPAMGNILVVGGLTLAVMMGLHIKAAHFFVMSYDLVPHGVFPNAQMIGQWGVQRVAAAFSLAFSLAAPFIVMSVIYNLALGAINKAMPQLMVAFVGAPLITAGGLVLLLFSAPMMLHVWVTAMDGFLAAPTKDTF